VEYWRSLATDQGAAFDKEVHIAAEDIAPTVTPGRPARRSLSRTRVDEGGGSLVCR
jgi:homoaconitase/3-isopropylmalate dehydratase large subunit